MLRKEKRAINVKVQQMVTVERRRLSS